MDASSAPRSAGATTRSRPASAATARPRPLPAATSASPSKNRLPRPSSSATPMAEPRSGTTSRLPSPFSTLPARPRSLPLPVPASASLAACASPPSLSPRPGRRPASTSQEKARSFPSHNQWRLQDSRGEPWRRFGSSSQAKTVFAHREQPYCQDYLQPSQGWLNAHGESSTTQAPKKEPGSPASWLVCFLMLFHMRYRFLILGLGLCWLWLWHLKAIAYAAYCAQIDRRAGVLFYLLPYPTHVDIQGPGVP
jgi:hypothetical protein